MSEVEKAKKRHCWPTDSAADAYEAGFESGATWQRERDATLALEQRCERLSHWDHACVEIANKIREQSCAASSEEKEQ